MRKLKTKRRAQEEMIGFVLIIVLVTIIVLVFLAISVRKPEEKPSKEIETFLHAILLKNTGCQPRLGEVYNLGELITACNAKESCLKGNTCEILNRTISQLIRSSFNIGEEYKGYEFAIKIDNSTLLSLRQGQLKGSKIGSSLMLPSSKEEVNIKMSLYY